MEKIEKLLEEIDSLTVIELSELVKGIEEKYGVSAAAVAAPAAGADRFRCHGTGNGKMAGWQCFYGSVTSDGIYEAAYGIYGQYDRRFVKRRGVKTWRSQKAGMNISSV